MTVHDRPQCGPLILGFVLFCALAASASPRLFAAAPQEPRATFERLFADWKQSAKDAIIARQKFVDCDADAADAIRNEWIHAIEKGRTVFDALVENAQLRLESEAETDPEVISLLAHVMELRYDIGDYERAFELGEKVLTHFAPVPLLLVRQAYSAHATNRFEKCRDYLTQLSHGPDGLPPEVTPIAAAIDQQVADWNREVALREAEAHADDLPRVELVVEQAGTESSIVLELFENEAPITVGNFIALVEKGFYDGRAFFRVATHINATTGCPSDNGMEGPGYTFPGEFDRPDARKHFADSVAMVASQDGRQGSQFYLNFLPNMELDGRSTVFGRVISGFSTIARLTRTHLVDSGGKTLRPVPNVTPAKIKTARVLRKRGHEYQLGGSPK